MTSARALGSLGVGRVSNDALAGGRIGVVDVPGPTLAELPVPRQRAAQPEEQRFLREPRFDPLDEPVGFEHIAVCKGGGMTTQHVDGVERRQIAQRLNGAREREAVELRSGVGVERIGIGAAAHVRHCLTVLAAVQGLACGDDAATGDAGADAASEIVDDRAGIDPTCRGGLMPVPAACTPVVAELPDRGRDHVPDTTAIPPYEDVPPASGNHRPSWAKWGEYDYLPPQRWLHNLEHGGIAFLYDPCAAPSLVDALRELARAQPDDDGGAFRWVLTPYPGLPTGVAAVAWQHTWQAGCVDEAAETALQTFITEHYRKAPEDVSSDGSYATGWIGR